MKYFASLFLCLFLLSATAKAVEPDEILSDPALEERARALSQKLRCVVCQNENIDSSNAPLARDLRLLVRERLVAGDTDEEILTFVVERYGSFVLLRPPFQWGTVFLWAGPLLGVMLGAAMVMAFYRREEKLNKLEPLTDKERERLRSLLEEDSA